MPAAPQRRPRRRLEQLAEQARALAQSIATIAEGSSDIRRVGQAGSTLSSADAEDEAALAQIARGYLEARRLREELFPAGLFCDPAWDILLDLFASGIERRQVCVSDAGIAAHVPQTTGLRWLEILARHDLVVRCRDPQDGRRWFVELTPKARVAIASWLGSAFPD